MKEPPSPPSFEDVHEAATGMHEVLLDEEGLDHLPTISTQDPELAPLALTENLPTRAERLNDNLNIVPLSWKSQQHHRKKALQAYGNSDEDDEWYEDE